MKNMYLRAVMSMVALLLVSPVFSAEKENYKQKIARHWNKVCAYKKQILISVVALSTVSYVSYTVGKHTVDKQLYKLLLRTLNEMRTLWIKNAQLEVEKRQAIPFYSRYFDKACTVVATQYDKYQNFFQNLRVAFHKRELANRSYTV